MQTYSLLREFADSWMLLALTLVFVGVIFWAYRPGSRSAHDAAAASIFRNDTRPKAAPTETEPR
ncbi:cbb3-type cytochrome c oxidase subunit 3 [Fertoebacter nigrum]|uniref:Cbb3-type cytochrome c oxidase subunit 3 n=1 Tax=Fertoeibacter niger TaxID=2656921 RepID=A0A8X8H2F3_9RHOB|nr:cbb3-type cytochrome c oxidase subunit 3 [Fertoeibacter niger]NUB44318.1 cbb3-type cytochrome c oxidase subunit 3 [Fertoeibacter niger]